MAELKTLTVVDNDGNRTTYEMPTTPEKGVDYWTEADKNEIKEYVEEAILGGSW